MFASIFRAQARLPGKTCRASAAFSASRTLTCNHVRLAIPRRHGQISTVFSRNLSETLYPRQTSISSDTLYIGNVPKSSNETEIKQIFKEVGAVKDVRIGKSLLSHTTFVHVQFEGVEDANKAYEWSATNPIRFKNRFLDVSVSTSSTQPASPKRATPVPSNVLFVGNIPEPADVDRIRRSFSRFGRVKDVRIGKDNPIHTLTYAHVEFENLEDAVKAYNSGAVKPIRFHSNVASLHFSRPFTNTLKLEKVAPFEARALFKDFKVIHIRALPVRHSITVAQFNAPKDAMRALKVLGEHKITGFHYAVTSYHRTRDTLVATGLTNSDQERARDVLKQLYPNRIVHKTGRKAVIYVEFDSTETAIKAREAVKDTLDVVFAKPMQSSGE